MGNLCAKGARQEPTKQLPVAKYPTEVNGSQVPRRPEMSPAPTSVQERVSTAASSKTLQAEKHGRDLVHVSPLQERNSPSSHLQKAEKQCKEERYGQASTSNAIERPFFRVNKKNEVLLPAYKHMNCFCYDVLRNATKKFSDKNLLGQGGFGDVYRGWIDGSNLNRATRDGGVAVAVKRLRKIGPCGHEEWMNEITFLSRLSHPNIVKLIGFCCEDEHKILVYELMTGGSLESHLLGENSKELNWSRRIKIAIGAAKGLNYLHTQGVPVIHRDLKASNVLLDKDFNPKLSDFGLAKYGPQGDQSHVTTRILGTQGYFAPEYIATGHLTLKTDIYSFGVVLLELLTGSGAIKKYSDGVGNLAQCAKPYLSDPTMLYRVIDKKLQWKYRKEEAQQFARIILSCLCLKPKNRPTMTQVVAELEQLQKNLGSCQRSSLGISACQKTSRCPFQVP